MTARSQLDARVLVADDDQAMCEVLETGLTRRGFRVQTVRRGEEALERLGQSDDEVLLTDLNMPGLGGIALCTESQAIRPDVPVIMLTAFGSLDTAISAMRAGAYDFITKPVELDVLALALDRAVSYARVRTALKRIREQLEGERATRGYAGMVGQSEAMRRVYDLLERTSGSHVTVLVTGESGTGKELVARALHERSPRSQGPFVAFNCAALPDALLESELFGHVKGAFTDARGARQGLFVKAQGGTLFLDEVGEMPLSMQAKLLRALQERKLRPVGSDEELDFDVRIIAATNRDLVTSVEEGEFRQDLYFRLNVLQVHMPPLRARGNDVLLLAQHFLARASASSGKPLRGIDSEAAAKMLAYSWPGNARELQNCIERAVALARFDQITVDDLPDALRNYRSSHVLVVAESATDLVPLDEVERRYVLRVMESVGGNRSVAARILRLDRKTLARKLDRWQREQP
jgi:two-component system response regulator HydG